MSKKTVVFDFDGVIHSYSSGWQGETVIPDPPVSGIKEAISDIMEDYRVVVVSTRCATEEGKAAIEAWLSKYGIEVDEVTKEKPSAICYIDDRAICFDGRPELLRSKIEAFKPWYHADKAPILVGLADSRCPYCHIWIPFDRLNGKIENAPKRCNKCGQKLLWNPKGG